MKSIGADVHIVDCNAGTEVVQSTDMSAANMIPDAVDSDGIDTENLVQQNNKFVRIRLYRQPRDWDAICELKFCCGPDGEVNLDRMSKELGVERICRVRFYLTTMNAVN